MYSCELQNPEGKLSWIQSLQLLPLLCDVTKLD